MNLAKLLYLVTGQFGKPGTNNLHTSLVPLIGHSKGPEEGGRATRVTGMREISKLYPGPRIGPDGRVKSRIDNRRWHR